MSREPLELLTAPDVGVVLGVKRSMAARTVNRDDFPAPYAVTPSGLRLWRRRDVERWNRTANRRVGRPTKAGRPLT